MKLNQKLGLLTIILVLIFGCGFVYFKKRQPIEEKPPSPALQVEKQLKTLKESPQSLSKKEVEDQLEKLIDIDKKGQPPLKEEIKKQLEKLK